MRVLVLGAGAIGGYFGGRLLEAGRDVTFLVRPARAARLKAQGLNVTSPRGDIRIAAPPTLQAGEAGASFDLVILSCKAFDLDEAIGSIAPAVGPDTAILPLLNGMRHLEVLERRFGPERVLGGQCVIASTLAPDGRVVHLNDAHSLTYGERDGVRSERIARIERLMDGAGFDAKASTEILLEMWEKWVFLASAAAGTCLMRATVGEIVAAEGGAAFMEGLIEEGRAIARGAGYEPRPAFLERARGMLTAAGSGLTASMMRDLEQGLPIEADHIVGDLIARGRETSPQAARMRLDVAYIHLKAYEARRRR